MQAFATINSEKSWKSLQLHISTGCISQTKMCYTVLCLFLITQNAKYASNNNNKKTMLQCECADYAKNKWNEITQCDHKQNYRNTTRVILTRHKNEQTNRQK